MNNRLTIPDIAGRLAERTGKDKQLAESFLKEFVAQVREGVYSDKIAKVKGVGTFKIIRVDSRESIHVGTGERFLIPAHYKFSFLPDKELRDLVNKPFSFFETTELKENVDFTDLEESEDAADKEADTEDESVEEVMPDEPVAEAAPVGSVPEEPEEPAASPASKPVLPEENGPAEPPEMLPELISAPEEESLEEEEKAEEEMPEENHLVSSSENSSANLPETPLPSENNLDFPEIDAQRNKKNAAVFRQYIVLGFALLMCCAGGAYLYVNRHFIRSILFGVEVVYPDAPAKQAVAVPASEPPASEREPAADTLNVSSSEGALSQPSRPATEPAESTASKPASPAAPKLLGTVKIKPGSRLTLIALEHYGKKVFWVYLYEYNKARISDPNNIPVGTTIEIPAPETYGIDARDKASVAKASARQAEILSGRK